LVGQQQFQWNNLNNLNSIVRGAQLPTSQTATTQGPLTRSAGPSPLALLGNTYSQVAGG
jgi:flagellar basal body rod protein FlgG